MAKQGLNFCQILGHYYQQVHLNDLAATSTPIGCLTINDQSGFATGTGLHIRAITPTAQGDLTVSINKVSSNAELPWTVRVPEAGGSAAPPATEVNPASSEQPSADQTHPTCLLYTSPSPRD